MPTTPPAAPTATFLARGLRIVPAAAMAVAAAGLLAACASASTQSAATTPHAATSSNRTSGASTSTSTSGPDGSATSGASGASGTPGLAACGSASLRVAVNTSQAGGAAGSTYIPVTFTNTSSSACGMYGYPGMSFVTADDSTAQQIGAAAQRNAQFAKQSVRLAAGGVAHAWLQVVEAGNYPPSACQPVTAHWLRVFAPGQTAAIYVNHSFAACSSSRAPLLTVMPVRAGQGTQGATP